MGKSKSHPALEKDEKNASHFLVLHHLESRCKGTHVSLEGLVWVMGNLF